MLAVILLIGIGVAVAAVSVTQGLSNARINAASSEMSAALRATRAQAIVRGTTTLFEVDTRRQSYRGIKSQSVRLPPGMDVSITSARADQAGPATGRIRFFPDGSSTGGHIVLKRGQRSWQINVAWLTGAVRVVVK